MADSNQYVPPKVWEWDSEANGRFAKMNRPTSGAVKDKILPKGNHPLQLYSLGTPNGVKVTILLEELLALGEEKAEYDAYLINIGDGDQFGSGFVEINPNSKIPALLDTSTNPETRVFESGAILLYLAEKFNAFIPSNISERAECFSWLMWQMGSTPYVGGGFGHFYAYAPEKWEYPINRYTMETKRLLDVLDKNLTNRRYLCGNTYNIADIANYSWYGYLVLHNAYDASQFLDVTSYKNVTRWAEEIEERPAVQRGRRVNRPWGDEKTRVLERHSSEDLD
ncbi:MAG: glutathione-dependent disulfide-bond oxidoreductase [Gammaproteobacteria bacterium]|nr:glutathione-dependent disulfide-bond oxidoreductase [Gammaproteobacteria bacterium]